MDLTTALFDKILPVLFSVYGISALLLAAMWAILLVVFPRMIWIHLGVMLGASTMSYTAYRWIDAPLYGPLQIWRDHAREVYILLLIAVTPWMLANFNRRTHQLKLLPSMTLFLALQLLYDGRLFLGGFYTYAAIGALIHIYTFAFFLVLLRQWDPFRDPYNLLRSFALGGAIFTITSLAQYAINPSAVLWEGRFSGITSNPQHAAMHLSVFVFATTACTIIRYAKPMTRSIFGVLAAISAVVIMWTGSRTGALMLAVAAIVTLRAKIGQWAILLMVLIGAFFVGVQFLPESTEITNRLVSTTNTRSAGWQENLNHFLESPIIGDVTPLPSGRPPLVENSYLAIIRMTGLVGGGVALIFLLFCLRDMTNLVRLKMTEGIYRDIALGAIAMLLIGAVFEGYLLAVISVGSMSLYLFSLIASSEQYLTAYDTRESSHLN